MVYKYKISNWKRLSNYLECPTLGKIRSQSTGSFAKLSNICPRVSNHSTDLLNCSRLTTINYSFGLRQIHEVKMAEGEVKDPKMFKGKQFAIDTINPELVQKWTAIQEDLRHRIILTDTSPWQGEPDLRNLKLVAGLDISYPIEAAYQETQGPDCYAFAAIVILSYPELKVVYEDVQRVPLDIPYVPGFLAFRESVPLIKIVEKAIAHNHELKPDVLLVDGNGILHPQQCGSACHIGYHSGIPTIGVAKNLIQLKGMECTRKMGQDMLRVGDHLYLRGDDNQILGMALKTASEAKNPVYVSVGHKISLESARRVVLAVSKYRVPEPIRFADNLSRELIRKTESEESKSKESKT